MSSLTPFPAAGRTSWLASANTPDGPFPIQNLPYGIFSTAGVNPRVGVAIGDQILDLRVLEEAGLLPAGPAPVFAADSLNPFMACGPAVWRAVRAAIADLLDAATPTLRDAVELRARALVPMDGARLHLPMVVRGFTDFYASKEHATNVGSMFRDPANALLPNWLHIPIGYNGRASTVVVSGTPIRRPLGQTKPPGAAGPAFGPARRLDLELELGAVVGVPSAMGSVLTTAQADAMIFGYVLLNDWSARDIQAWEYQPLGPFQAKAFATSISPWIVPAAALAPFRVPAPARLEPLLPYLRETGPNNYDITLEAWLQPAGAARASRITRTNFRDMYYSPAQQLTHHAVGGCAMCVGDLLGSGTVSGQTAESLGSLLELTWNGARPLTLETGETRTFLEDGDTLTLAGWAQGAGYRIGFGTCSGTILPALTEPDWPGGA